MLQYVYPGFVLLCWTIVAGAGAGILQRSTERRLPLSFGAILGGTALILAVLVPKTHNLFFDEHLYLSIANAIQSGWNAHVPTAAVSNEDAIRILAGTYNKEPPGFSVALAVGFLLLPSNEIGVWVMNQFFLLVGTVALYALALTLSNSRKTAALSAFFFCTTPMLLRWTNTGAVETYASCCTLIAMLGAVRVSKTLSVGSYALFLGGMGLAASARPELVLMIIPALASIDLLCRETWKKKVVLVGTAFIPLVIPAIHLLSVWHESWGAETSRFSLEFLVPHLVSNVFFFFSNDRYPVLWTTFAIIGLFGITRGKAVTIVWFLVVWGIFLPFYAGSYDHGADVRYSLLTAAPLSLFAADGFNKIASVLTLRLSRVLLHTALAVTFASFLPLLSHPQEQGSDARKSVEDVGQFATLLQPGDLVVSYVPSVWLPYRHNVLQLSHALSKTRALYQVCEKSQRVLFHWDYWCQKRHALEAPACNGFVKRYGKKVLQEIRSPLLTSKLYLIEGLCPRKK